MSLVARPPTQELTDLVGALGGEWHGPRAMCRCPAHQDHYPSLSLRQGHTGILVHCFAGCAPKDVLRELASIKPEVGHKVPESRRDGGTANIERIWSGGEPIIGSMAEAYLRGRGLTELPADLRYHALCPLGRSPGTRFLPALLVRVREGTHLRAIQRIFLGEKPGTYDTKRMIGSPGQGSWQGYRPGSELALAEGFETAAAFHQVHGIPCWSTLGGERLDRVTIPPQVRTLVIAEDNDVEGRRFAAKAVEAHTARGLRVRRAAPPSNFGDWADALTGRERGGGSTR